LLIKGTLFRGRFIFSLGFLSQARVEPEAPK